MTQPARIPPLPSDKWTPEVEALFPILVPPGAPVKGSDFNALLVLAHHPELARRFIEFNAAVSRSTALSPALRELAVLRVAWRTGCLYEWVHHLIAGAAAGLTVAHFHAVQEPEVSTALTLQEQAILRATDEICRDAMISDATWQDLEGFLDNRQILDLLFAAGCFQTVSALLNSTRAEVEPAFLDMVIRNGWPLLASR